MKTLRTPVLFTIITFAIIMYNIFLLANAAESVQAAKSGLQLWFNQVLPTLFPFAVGANLLLGLGFARILGRVFEPVMRRLFRVSGVGGFAFLTGLISGYPMGAKITAALRTKGELRQDEAQRLIAFSNNAGPLFILGFAAGLFGNVEAGKIILTAHIFSAVLTGVILGAFSQKIQPVTRCNRLNVGDAPLGVPGEIGIPGTPRGASPTKGVLQQPPYGTLFSDSVKNAMESMVLVGGYIILFSVLVDALNFLPFTEFLEIANGTKIAAQARSIPLAAAVISFGGFSVHAQAAHFMKESDIRFAPYLAAKVLQGGLAWIAALAIVHAPIFF